MITRRQSLIPESELRRCARVARKEGVAVRCRRETDGSFTVEFSPSAPAFANDGDDLDARLDAFAAS